MSELVIGAEANEGVGMWRDITQTVFSLCDRIYCLSFMDTEPNNYWEKKKHLSQDHTIH